MASVEDEAATILRYAQTEGLYDDFPENPVADVAAEVNRLAREQGVDADVFNRAGRLIVEVPPEADPEHPPGFEPV